MLMACLLPAHATESNPVQNVEICASYWQEGMLYTFAHLPMEDFAEQDASLFVNNAQYQMTTPVSVLQTDTPIHYMLLIDTSTSMPQYRNKILALAEELMTAEANVEITVAKFDRVFSVVDERLSDWDAVKASLKSLDYTGDASDISGSVAGAIAYLGAEGYPEGEMTNLVVITDGEPWYSNNKETEKECEEQSNLAAAKMIAAYPEIVVHTYSFCPWDDDLYAAVSAGTGLHMVETSVTEAGKALADFTDTLYEIPFSLRGYDNMAQIREQLMLNIGNYFVSYNNVRNAMIVPEVDLEHTQEDNPEEESVPDDTTEHEETTVPDETTAPDETHPEGTEGTTTTETAESEGTVDATEGTGDPAILEGDPQVIAENMWQMVLVWCAIATGLIIVIVAVILLAKKFRVRAASVRMRIQVTTGNARVKKEYYLAREIVIGTDRNCDIVLPHSDTGVASARIFRQGQVIYVEDMGSTDGTLINGMRIFSSNRLRSGDEITVGMTTLRVFF